MQKKVGLLYQSLLMSGLRDWTFAIFLCLSADGILASENAAFEANFEALITQADSLYSESGNLPASISLLRSALELCPNCKAPIQKGQLSEKVFVFDNFADRRLLSDSIFPVLQSYKPKRILWVGIQPYTLRGLYELQQLNASVTSIEPDLEQAAFGSHHHHITASLGELPLHVPDGYFHCVIINGVIGWGIDGELAVEAAVQTMFRALQTNGLIIVGWNKGMGTCCDFDPWFHHRRLGNLGPIMEVPDSETHHIFEFLRRNDRAEHLLTPRQ